jgi:phage gp36-like protein
VRKVPAEIVDVPIDFTNRLAVGETIVSATASVVGTGTITVGTPAVTNPIVTVRVSDGTDGKTDSFLVLATTNTGEVLPALVDVEVTSSSSVGASYSTPENLAKRIGARIYAGLSGDGVTSDDAIAQGMLDAATREIHRKIGTRYVTPVTEPTRRLELGDLEEQIAYWLLYVRNGFGPQDTGAAAAKIGYDNAIATLLLISKSELDLPGAAPRDDGSDDDTASGFIMQSETPHYKPPDQGEFS